MGPAAGRVMLLFVSGLLVLAPAGAGPAAEASGLTLVSSAFRPGARIPVVYTCDGRNVSPPLRWTAPPRGTRSLALLVHDPDAPRAGGFTHWIAYGISPARRGLPSGVHVAHEGLNDTGRTGYTGPCPPSGTHRYVFTLYALDSSLRPKSPLLRTVFLELVRGHVLGRATLVGRYGR